MMADRTGERMAVLVIVGFLLFNPPLLWTFDGDGQILGLPTIFVGLFAAWAILILLMALVIERGHHDVDGEDGSGHA